MVGQIGYIPTQRAQLVAADPPQDTKEELPPPLQEADAILNVSVQVLPAQLRLLCKLWISWRLSKNQSTSPSPSLPSSTYSLSMWTPVEMRRRCLDDTWICQRKSNQAMHEKRKQEWTAMQGQQVCGHSVRGCKAAQGHMTGGKAASHTPTPFKPNPVQLPRPTSSMKETDVRTKRRGAPCMEPRRLPVLSCHCCSCKTFWPTCCCRTTCCESWSCSQPPTTKPRALSQQLSGQLVCNCWSNRRSAASPAPEKRIG